MLISCDRRPFPSFKEIAEFQIAVKKNDKKVVDDYIKRYKKMCMFESKNFDGSSYNAVSSAVMSGDVEMLKLVIKHDAAVNYRNMPGAYTALHLAAECGYPEMAEILIKNKADVNAVDSQGNNVFHQICYNSRDVRLLEVFRLYSSELINAENNAGLTPLYYALVEDQSEGSTKTRNSQMVEWLLRNGADLRLVIGKNKDWDVFLPLIQNKDNDYLRMIFSYEKGKIPNTVISNFNYLQMAIWYQNWEMVPFFIGLVDDVNNQDEFGRTALHLAAYFNERDIVALLLKNGLNKEIKDREGNTAFDTYIKNHKTYDKVIMNDLRVD